MITTIITFLAFFIISYFFINLFADPGNSLEGLKDSRSAESIITYYRFDKPLIIQFFQYVINIFQGDFGPILGQNNGFNTIPQLLFSSMRITWSISLIAFFVAIVFGFSLGSLAAFKANKTWDIFITLFVLLFSASPAFVFAPLIIVIIQWFGGYPIYEANRGVAIETLSLIGPTLILIFISLTSLTYIVKNEVQEIIHSEYYQFAKAKGQSFWQLYFRYVIKNSLIPVIALLPPFLLGAITNLVLIETIFLIPGNSNLIFHSVKNGEIFVALFTINFYVLTFYVLVFLAEVILMFLFQDQNSISSKKLKFLHKIRSMNG